MRVRALKKKISLNLPLNVADCELKAEIDRLLLKPKEGVHFDSDGSFTHYRSVDAQPIVDAVKERSSLITKADRRKAKNGAVYLGSVDMITAGNWAKECGCAIGTKEYNAYAKKKLQSGEWNHFKAEFVQ
jgi:hypothetical protein